jgi:hypothetical protein
MGEEKPQTPDVDNKTGCAGRAWSTAQHQEDQTNAFKATDDYN